MMFWTDRIGRQMKAGPWWFRLCLGYHSQSGTWYGVLRIARRTVWLRPIDYRAIGNA